MGVWVALAFCARVGCARRIWWVRAGGCLVDVWLLACVGVLLARERGLACVRVAWINEKGEGEGTCQRWFPLPLFFFFCGADDGSRTRYLHLGVVVLRRLSYVVSNRGRGLRS